VSAVALRPFTAVTGRALPLLLPNVDTDVIVRIERLTTLGRDALGPVAFEALRGRGEPAAAALDDPRFAGAPILLAAENFGCGSSREGAVWALQGMGVRAVLAPSFGDIFFSNCFQNGVLPVRLPIETVRRLAAAGGEGGETTVDLVARRVVSADGTAIPFEVDAQRRDALLHGLDAIGLTLRDDAAIRAWQREDRTRRPWVWELPPADLPIPTPTANPNPNPNPGDTP
jgi:3-isopropylmalate/(R)-2-methylmalate dehydratase small subunit